jgi:CHAP domain-containing protein
MSEADVIQRVRRIALDEAKKSAAGALDEDKPVGTNTNNVKYNTAYYGFPEDNPDKAWCVVFIWWVMRHAGVPATVFPRKASVFRAQDGGVRAWFKARDRYMSPSSMPTKGDLVIFKKSHIGIVENVEGNTISTVEGNASDRVRRHSYNRTNSDIDGYCHPAYDMVKDEEEDMTPQQAAQLKAVADKVERIENVLFNGHTRHDIPIDNLFGDAREIRDALIVPGTTTAEDAFNLLFARIREIHKKVVEEQ